MTFGGMSSSRDEEGGVGMEKSYIKSSSLGLSGKMEFGSTFDSNLLVFISTTTFESCSISKLVLKEVRASKAGGG
jgi:hypothetical protein